MTSGQSAAFDELLRPEVRDVFCKSSVIFMDLLVTTVHEATALHRMVMPIEVVWTLRWKRLCPNEAPPVITIISHKYTDSRVVIGVPMSFTKP